jgi:hypothetical protein
MLGQKAPLSQRFCSYPFSLAEIHNNGKRLRLLPGWLRGGPSATSSVIEPISFGAA